MNFPYNSKLIRITGWAILISIGILALTYFRSFLQPFAIALVIWYMIFELKRLIGKITIKEKTLPKGIRTIIATFSILILLALFYEIIIYNMQLILKKLPFYFNELKEYLQQIDLFNQLFDFQQIIQQLEFNEIGNLATGIMGSITAIAGDFFMIIIFVLFLMVEEVFMEKKFHNMMYESRKSDDFYPVFKRVSHSIRRYLSVKTFTSLLTGILSYIMLTILDVEFATFWAFLIFIFNYIPYLGSLIATLLPSIFAILQFNSLLSFVWVFMAVESIQLLVGNFIEPKVMGRSLNLSPLGVILALSFWGSLWGVIGMIIAVPAASILVIILSQFSETRFLAIMFSETGDIKDFYTEDDK